MGQCHYPRRALEEPCSSLPLQTSHGLCDSRTRQAKVVGGGRETSRFGGGGENAKYVQVGHGSAFDDPNSPYWQLSFSSIADNLLIEDH
jgi:hypothetical protein